MNSEKIGAIIVTVDKYNDENLHDLNSAKDNGITLREILQSNFLNLKRENISLLQNQNKRPILFEVQKLIKKFDILIFYYSGHGIVDENDSIGFNLYLSTQASNLSMVFLDSISIYELNQVLSARPNLKLIMILDCCFSGDFKSKISLNNFFFIASSNSTSKSKYPKEEQFSIFTNALIDVCKNGIDGEGKLLSIKQIYQAVSLKISNLNNGTIAPVQSTTGNIGDLPLFNNEALKPSQELGNQVLSNEYNEQISDCELKKYRENISAYEKRNRSINVIESIQTNQGLVDSAFLFGRNHILKKIFLALLSGRNRCISGVKWIGKTSLMQSIGAKEVQEIYSRHFDLPLDEIIFKYYDLRQINSPTQFYHDISKSISVNNIPNFENPLNNIRKILNDKGKKLVLLLDNYDSILRNNEFDEQFINNLRVNSSHNSIKIAYSRTIGRKYTEIENRKKHYFFASVEKVGFLSVESAIDFLLFPLSNATKFDFNSDINRLIFLGGRHPFFLSHLRNIVFSEIKQKGNKFDMYRIEKQFNNEVIRFYKAMLSSLNQNAINMLFKIITQNEKTIDDTFDPFIEINSSVEEVNVFSDHFKQYFLESYYPLVNKT